MNLQLSGDLERSMSVMELPAPPPAPSCFALKSSLQWLVLLTWWNLTRSQPRTLQLQAWFVLLKQCMDIRFCAMGEICKGNLNSSLTENQEEDWSASMHFCNLNYLTPISAVSVRRCSLKMLTKTFLLGNVTHINVALLTRGKYLELLSAYEFAGFILFLGVLWILNFSWGNI